jgi:DNA-binding MarR family transcriptional regulator
MPSPQRRPAPQALGAPSTPGAPDSPDVPPLSPPQEAGSLAGVSRKEVVGLSELVVRLVLVSRSLERVRPRRGPDLSPHAVRATLHLFQHGQGTVGELAEGLGVSMGWASRIADELERVGHVLRERDADDRRVVRLRLSDGAMRLAEDMYRERGRAVAEALALLSREERGTVERFLRDLTERLEALVTSPPPPVPESPPPPQALQ